MTPFDPNDPAYDSAISVHLETPRADERYMRRVRVSSAEWAKIRAAFEAAIEAMYEERRR